MQCHQDLKSKQSVAVHWGTFQLTGEPLLEPPQKLAAALAENQLSKEAFVCMDHGEVKVFDLLLCEHCEEPESES